MNQQTNKLIPVPGAAGYLVNEQGDVLSQRPGQTYGTYLRKYLHNGYCQYSLRRNGAARYSTAMAHRIVAEAFIPNPEGKPTVNHKDGNKANNHVSNLEWATMKEQQQHAIRTGLRKPQYGAENALFGRKFPPRSAETKAKMSAAKLGASHPTFIGYYLTPAGRFASKMQAAAASGTSVHQVNQRCHAGQVTGWSFEPAPRQSAIKL